MMEFKRIEEEQIEQPPEPVWREDRPPDRVFLVSNGSEVIVLDYIGRLPEYLADEGMLHEYVRDFPPGVHVVEIVGNSYRTAAGDYDLDVEFPTDRPATDDEVVDWRDHCVPPWDSSDYIANLDEIREWHDKHMRGQREEADR